MSDLAAEHARCLDIVTREAGLMVQPARRGLAANDVASAIMRFPALLDLLAEFYRDACDTSAEHASEGDAIRSAWE